MHTFVTNPLDYQIHLSLNALKGLLKKKLLPESTKIRKRLSRLWQHVSCRF